MRMRAALPISITVALGLGVLGASLRRRSPDSTEALLRAAAYRSIRPTRHTPADVALREASCWESQAMQVVSDDLEAWAAWDPAAPVTLSKFAWRQGLARDRGGYLARARATAQRALALARTPAEAYRATWKLAQLECDAGHHAAELQQARRLLTLAPNDPESRWAVLHAQSCRSQERLSRSGRLPLQEGE